MEIRINDNILFERVGWMEKYNRLDGDSIGKLYKGKWNGIWNL